MATLEKLPGPFRPDVELIRHMVLFLALGVCLVPGDGEFGYHVTDYGFSLCLNLIIGQVAAEAQGRIGPEPKAVVPALMEALEDESSN